MEEKDNSKKSMLAIIFSIVFIIGMITVLVVYFNLRNKSKEPAPVVDTATEDEQAEVVTDPTEEIEGLDFDDLTASLFKDMQILLSCDDVHYFTPQTPGVYIIDLIDAREALGKCETMSYSIWDSSEFSTALTKGQYMMDIPLNSSTSDYDEVLIYFYTRDYNGKSSIESISFDYINQN